MLLISNFDFSEKIGKAIKKEVKYWPFFVS